MQNSPPSRLSTISVINDDQPFNVHRHGYVRNIHNWHNENVYTPFWRLYWNTISGGVLHCTDKKDIVMETGHFYLLPANYMISTDSLQDFEQISIHFILGDIYKADNSKIYCLKGDEFSSMLAEDYLRSWTLNDNRLRCDILAYTILGYVLQKYQNEINLHKLPKNKHIFDCLNYISAHLGSNLDNNRLSRVAGLVRSAFVRLFSEIMGESPQAFVRRKRIEKACYMLNSSTMTLKEIATDLGFANQYHFSKVFKKLQWENPTAFRNGHQVFNDSFDK